MSDEVARSGCAAGWTGGAKDQTALSELDAVWISKLL